MSDQEQTSSINNSEELYTACRSDNEQLQNAAYNTLWKYLYRVAWYTVRDQPDAQGLAKDCAGEASARIFQRIAECRNPTKFLSWAGQIVRNIAIDELRRQKPFVSLDPDEADEEIAAADLNSPPLPEDIVLEKITRDELYNLIDKAPISLRSRRVVLGRFFDDEPDEKLAQAESQRANGDVLPSHIQTTRSKNISDLKKWLGST